MLATVDDVTQVIDVSGDGAQNDGDDTSDARDAALLAGVDRINGLAILGEPGLLDFYKDNIQGGTDSFTLAAASFADFGDAVTKKFEGGGGVPMIPVPASALLLLTGVAAFGAFARRKMSVAA